MDSFGLRRNQFYHDLLDRTLVLPVLQALTELTEVDFSSLGDGQADQDGGNMMRMPSWMRVDMKRRVSLIAESMGFLRTG
jgi:hypothetical protein